MPDPTVLTTSLVDRAEKALKEWAEAQLAVRDQRIDGNDEATKLHRMAEAHPGVMPMIEGRVVHLERLMNEKFEAVGIQFRDRDTLALSVASLNALALTSAFAASKEAVAAALTAQQQASAKQDEANQKAIEKSERATAETIKTNSELAATRLDSLTKSLDEAKLQINSLVSVKQGGKEDRTALYAGLAALAVVVGIVIAIGGVLVR